MSSDGIAYHESGYCEFPARLDQVAQVSALLKAFCQGKCLDETLWPQIDLAFCECLNNAVEHGCGEDPSKIVKASWRWLEDNLLIEVEDPGVYREPAHDHALPANPLAESGRGNFIIDSIADSHRREPTAYGQKVSLKIATHLPSDAIEKLEETYALLQTLTNDLNASYAEQEIVQGFAKDMANLPAIEQIIAEGVTRLRGIVQIERANVWKLLPEGAFENMYCEGSGSLTIREAVVHPDKASACCTVVATEIEALIEDCSILAQDDPLYRQSGCAIVCPIVYQKDCLGVLALHSPQKEKTHLFKKALPLAKVLAQFLGMAYTSAKAFSQREEQERSNTQLEVAAEIQRSLLPSSYPSNKHCQVTGRCEAAMAVGGDYIDAIEIRDAGLLVVIADVMGKGVPAALLATIFRTAIRSRLNLAETPGWLLSKINKQFHEELGHLNMFITAQAAFLDYGKKVLKLASAGHCPALLLDGSSSEIQNLQAEGIPLGIDPEDLYEERLIELQTNSRLLFLTDGFYEAENADGEMLGVDRLTAAAASFWQDGIEAVPNHAFHFVSKFSQGHSARDDRTLLALEVL